MLAIETFPAAYDLAVFVEQDQGREVVDTELGTHGAWSVVAGTEQRLIADVLQADRFTDFLYLFGQRTIFVGDADSLKPIGSIGLVEIDQIGDCLPAGEAGC